MKNHSKVTPVEPPTQAKPPYLEQKRFAIIKPSIYETHRDARGLTISACSRHRQYLGISNPISSIFSLKEVFKLFLYNKVKYE